MTHGVFGQQTSLATSYQFQRPSRTHGCRRLPPNALRFHHLPSDSGAAAQQKKKILPILRLPPASPYCVPVTSFSTSHLRTMDDNSSISQRAMCYLHRRNTYTIRFLKKEKKNIELNLTKVKFIKIDQNRCKMDQNRCKIDENWSKIDQKRSLLMKMNFKLIKIDVK